MFWANEEKAAFEAFVTWAHDRWKQDAHMHIYHYAAYEKTALRRLMGKYGTRESEVDDWLRNEVFVDLFTLIRQAIKIGEPKYSIKNIEHLYISSIPSFLTHNQTHLKTFAVGEACRRKLA